MNPVAQSFEVAEALGGIQPVLDRDCRCPRLRLPDMSTRRKRPLLRGRRVGPSADVPEADSHTREISSHGHR